jgi:hypothetical protein
MIDWFALGLIHALLVYVFWHLLSRDDLDVNSDTDHKAGARKEPPGNA